MFAIFYPFNFLSLDFTVTYEKLANSMSDINCTFGYVKVDNLSENQPYIFSDNRAISLVPRSGTVSNKLKNCYINDQTKPK